MGDSQNPPSRQSQGEEMSADQVRAAVEQKRAARRAMALGANTTPTPVPKTPPGKTEDAAAKGATDGPKKYVPFYAKRAFQIVVGGLALAAAITVGVIFLLRFLHRGELSVREELAGWVFDHQPAHLEALDTMGPPTVTMIVGLLGDSTEVEGSLGHSTTKTQEAALDYLVHYAQKVGVPPPPIAADAAKKGSYRLRPEDWPPIKTAFEKWWADVQAQGKALK